MTRDEAIKIIDNFFCCVVFPRCNGKLYSHSRLDEAVKIAIEALKQPEIVHCKDCKSNRNENGTTGCDFHNFWYAADDGYCNFGQRRGEE